MTVQKLEQIFFGGEKESLDVHIEDQHQQEWVVRYVGDCENEYQRLFTCSLSELPQKILEDENLNGYFNYSFDENNYDHLNTPAEKLALITEGVQNQTNSLRIMSLNDLKKGYYVKMRMGGYK